MKGRPGLVCSPWGKEGGQGGVEARRRCSLGEVQESGPEANEPKRLKTPSPSLSEPPLRRDASKIRLRDFYRALPICSKRDENGKDAHPGQLADFATLPVSSAFYHFPLPLRGKTHFSESNATRRGLFLSSPCLASWRHMAVDASTAIGEGARALPGGTVTGRKNKS